MKWINPKYMSRSREDGDLILTEVYLGHPDDCMFGDRVKTFDGDGEQVHIRFPIDCSGLSTELLNAGSRLAYVSDNDSVPYNDVAVRYDRLGRTYIIGRADSGRFFVHCKLNNGHGFITEV